MTILFFLTFADNLKQEASQDLFQTPPDLCQLPQARGPCKAALLRYFYNSTSNACEPFTYGGCQGNDNNFETTEMCFRICQPPGESSDRPRKRNGGDRILGVKGQGVGEDAGGDMLIWELVMMRIRGMRYLSLMPGRGGNEGAGSVDSKAVVAGGTDNKDERWVDYCSKPF